MTSARAQDVLHWLSRVIAESSSRDQDSATPHLIATALAERERWMRLITQAVKSADGVLVNAVAMAESVECGEIESDAPQVLALARELLVAADSGDGGASEIQVRDGRAALVAHGSSDGANAAQRAIREVAIAICDHRLRSSGLVALVYTEEAMDLETASVVWQALMKLPDCFTASARPTTILLIAGDGADSTGVHCTGARGLQFRITNDALEERHSYSHNEKLVNDIGNYDQQTIPLAVGFLGAGASIGWGLPSGDALRDSALARLMNMPVDPATFSVVARAFYDDLAERNELQPYELAAGPDTFIRTLTLERVLEHELVVDGDPYTTTMRKFAQHHEQVASGIRAQRAANELAADPVTRLCQHRKRLVLATVNFDQLVEARGGDHVRTFVTEDELLEFRDYLMGYAREGGEVPLLKLHGSIDKPETLAATTSSTTPGLSTGRQAAIQALAALIATQHHRPWTYVGYSMRDLDLANVWAGAEFPEFNERWVAPFLDPSVERFIAERRMPRWAGKPHTNSRNPLERLISLTAEDYFQQLADVADEASW